MMPPMRVTFLGTGTSHGIPVIGCDCAVCRSDDPRNKRSRPSILVQTGAANLLVDATPDFRAQALQTGLRQVDAVLVTHTHADHILGLDDLRVFTMRDARKMPVFASPESIENIRRLFPYACTETPAWPGLPSFALHPVEPWESFGPGGATVRALPLPHGKMTVHGFLFGRDLAYVTDCHAVSDEVVAAIRGVTVLALDALRHRPHPTHLTVAQALEVAGRVGAKLTLLTHLCHDLDHAATEQSLPPHIRVARDGLRLSIANHHYSPDP
jgi:phosphoribosyl 1,2-cyclic phosphate phosphodiesterase